MKEITLETKISELLNDYEGMKDILIEINPKFKKLNNPVLRRTIAKIAGVRQAAIVGGMEPMDLLNKLRKAVGQNVIEGAVDDESKSVTSEVPKWILNKPASTLYVNELLDRELNPLAESHKALRNLKKGEIITIVSDFQPKPLIDEFSKLGYEVYLQKVDDDEFVTYIKK